MTKKKKIEEIRNKLIAKKKSIISQLKKFAKKNDKIKDDYETNLLHLGEHLDENAIEVADYASNISIEHNLEEGLKSIEGALKKTSEGTYGVCSNCGEPINPKRLEIAPEATLCVKCGEKK